MNSDLDILGGTARNESFVALEATVEAQERKINAIEAMSGKSGFGLLCLSLSIYIHLYPSMCLCVFTHWTFLYTVYTRHRTCNTSATEGKYLQHAIRELTSVSCFLTSKLRSICKFIFSHPPTHTQSLFQKACEQWVSFVAITHIDCKIYIDSFINGVVYTYFCLR